MTENESFDPTRRQLCPDGSCIGVLDDTGRCKECGRDASGAAPEPEAEPEAELAAGGFDPGRRLCPDGSCIGLVGPDGRCKVCGRAEEP